MCVLKCRETGLLSDPTYNIIQLAGTTSVILPAGKIFVQDDAEAYCHILVMISGS